MPAPRGDRQTVADPHRELAATLNKQLEAGIAPWQTPWTPGARVPRGTHHHAAAGRAARQRRS